MRVSGYNKRPSTPFLQASYMCEGLSRSTHVLTSKLQTQARYVHLSVSCGNLEQRAAMNHVEDKLAQGLQHCVHWTHLHSNTRHHY